MECDNPPAQPICRSPCQRTTENRWEVNDILTLIQVCGSLKSVLPPAMPEVIKDKRYFTDPIRIFSIPLNSSGELEMIQPMWMTSSCCTTASLSSCNRHLSQIMFLITAGDKGLEITASSWPKAPRVTCSTGRTIQRTGKGGKALQSNSETKLQQFCFAC